ncbi:hypothetical protein FRX31_033780, partial [Thalictrum thalictroides]
FIKPASPLECSRFETISLSYQRTLQNLDGKTPHDVGKLNNQQEVLKLPEKKAYL